MSVTILKGDCRDMLKTLPDESVHCVVTSPPYWGLRDYGVDGQPGMEATYDVHVATMVEVFREVRRVLRKDGTLWLNYGDSYATSVNGRSAADTKAAGNDDRTFRDKPFSTIQGVLKPKDLCGIPWRVAFALQADGWWLRQDIIWSKPNPMPESVTDRCTKAHEYLFLFTKAERYFYDAEAIKEPANYPEGPGNVKPVKGADQRFGETRGGLHLAGPNETRNKRSVWTVNSQPFPDAHFATFPPALIEPCIKAGTSEKGCCPECGGPWRRNTERIDQGYDGSKYGERAVEANGGAVTGGTDKSTLGSSNGKLVGKRETLGWEPSCGCYPPLENAPSCFVPKLKPAVVLDPFGGAGTTGLVADRLGRNAILIELNPEYAAMAERRIKSDAGLFSEVAA